MYKLHILIQEKPNSHFVSHTICFMVKDQSSVTFKELLSKTLEKGAVRKYVFFLQRGANWAFDGVFGAKLVSEDAFSLCGGSS